MDTRAARELGLDIRKEPDDFADLLPFHCITFWHSLEHLRNPVAALSTVRKLIAEDGLVMVAVPNSGGLQAVIFGANWLHLDVPRHLYHFNDTSLNALLRLTGFTPVHRWNQEFEYDLMGWSQSALNAVLRTPNVFFDLLTQRRGHATAAEEVASQAGGFALSALALPLVALGTLLGRGGTLVMAARPNPV
jgi:hypothetical protein